MFSIFDLIYLTTNLQDDKENFIYIHFQHFTGF